MSSALTLKPLLKPGVTDLVLTSAGRLNVCTYGSWTSALKAEFRELFVLLLEEIEPRAVERFKAGESSLVSVLPTEQGYRLRTVVYESTNAATDRVIEISIRVIPAKIPTAGAGFPRRLVETMTMLERGLFLVAGGSGQGKSTFSATLVQEYFKRNRTRAVVLNEPLEHFFQDDGLVTYRSTPASVKSIEQALWLNPALLFVEKVEDTAVKNRLAQVASSQVVVSTVQAQDAISALQAWLGPDGVASDLFAHSLAGLVVVELHGDGTHFKPRYQVTLFGDEVGESEFALRSLVAQRDWTRLRRRLDESSSSTRRVA